MKQRYHLLLDIFLPRQMVLSNTLSQRKPDYQRSEINLARGEDQTKRGMEFLEPLSGPEPSLFSLTKCSRSLALFLLQIEVI
jgi:hypothetical protein